jgi:hypothetical protein
VALRSSRIVIALLCGSIFAAWTPVYLRYQLVLQSSVIEILSIYLGLPGYFVATFITFNTSPPVWLMSLADFIFYSLFVYCVLTLYAALYAAYKKQPKSPKS